MKGKVCTNCKYLEYRYKRGIVESAYCTKLKKGVRRLDEFECESFEYGQPKEEKQ